MERIQHSHVVDLTGSSDSESDSPTSQEPSSNRTAVSTRRSGGTINMGNKQSAVDLIDLTMSDNESEISIYLDAAANFSAVPENEPSNSSPLHQEATQAKDNVSAVVTYPIRQPLRERSSLTSTLSETSPSTNPDQPPDTGDQPARSGDAPASSNNSNPPFEDFSTRRTNASLNGNGPESQDPHANRKINTKSEITDRPTRSSGTSGTITVDLPVELRGAKARKTAASSTTGIKVMRPTFPKPASRSATQPTPVISAPSPSRTTTGHIPETTTTHTPLVAASPALSNSPEVTIDCPPIRSEDIILAKAMVETALKRHLRTVHESHAYLVRASLRRNRLCLEREAREKERKKKASDLPISEDKPWFIQAESPFKKMKPVQSVFSKNDDDIAQPYFVQDVFNNPRSKTGIKLRIKAPITKFRSTAIPIPAFREYVPLKDNLLAENQGKLFNWPYFPDEKKREDMNRELHANYKIKNEIPSWDDKLIDVHRFYGSSIEAFLREISIAWQDVIYLLLASDQDIKRISDQGKSNDQRKSEEGEYEKIFSKRQSHWEPVFNPERTKWENLVASLSVPTLHKLRLAALACEAFLKQSSFKLWHLARRSEFMNARVQSLLEGNKPRTTKFEYRNYACRICQMHHCPYHGAFEEVPGAFDDAVVVRNSHSPSLNGSRADSEDSMTSDIWNLPESSSSDSSSDSESSGFDSDVEVVINHRRYVNAQAGASYIVPAKKRYRGFTTKPPPGEFKASWWKTKTVTANWEKRTPFFPCKHEGPCDKAQCRCYRHGITCEKICSCSESCERRFPGCSCAQVPNGKQNPCRTAKCLCLTMGRECDADLCGTCGATEILDPLNRYNEDLSKACGNVAIQRGVPTKTFIGHSEVHGFGLYIGEDIQKDDFIGEYVGEVVSVREGERRGIIYAQQQTMYLFKLNSEQDIDSTHFSNKSRFINNANPEYTNCYPRDKLCNGVHRLGLYASTTIKAGTELFFHYGYSEDEMKNFKQPSRKKNIVKSNGTTHSNDIRVPKRPPVGPLNLSQTALKSAASTTSRVSIRRNKPQEEVPETDNEDEEWEPSQRTTKEADYADNNNKENEADANDDNGQEEIPTSRALRQRRISMAPGGRSITTQQQAPPQQRKAKGKQPSSSSSASTATTNASPRKKNGKQSQRGGARPGAGRKRKRPMHDGEE